MAITRDTRIEYLYTVVRFLSDYANLSDDSDFFRGISQIAPEIFENSSGEIEMSSLNLYCNASALAPSLGFAHGLLLFSNFEAWYIPR